MQKKVINGASQLIRGKDVFKPKKVSIENYEGEFAAQEAIDAESLRLDREWREEQTRKFYDEKDRGEQS